jgi:hypothetical protein
MLQVLKKQISVNNWLISCSFIYCSKIESKFQSKYNNNFNSIYVCMCVQLVCVFINEKC